MMGTSPTDLKFLQDKIGEKELASSIDKEKQERRDKVFPSYKLPIQKDDFIVIDFKFKSQNINQILNKL